jgi:hypothetical protein
MNEAGVITMRCFQSVLTLGMSTFYAFGSLAGEPTTISTEGFSVSFPAKWHVENDNRGTILASVRGENPPFIIINYAILPPSPTDEELTKFRTFQKLSIEDVLAGDKLKGVLEHSSWHSSAETIQMKNGVREDRQDIEVQGEDDKAVYRAACFFIRRYHAQRVEVYFAFLDDTTCKLGRPEFQELENSLVWNNR